MFGKVYIMTNPEIFRNNTFNVCRVCGQSFEKNEEYRMVYANGKGFDCKYTPENFYIHEKCMNKLTGTDEEKVIQVFSKGKPRAKNRFSEKQNKMIEIVKKNCHKEGYSFKDKDKYIHITGMYPVDIRGVIHRAKIKGKYDKVSMKMEASEKGLNLSWFTQMACLNSLLK